MKLRRAIATKFRASSRVVRRSLLLEFAVSAGYPAAHVEETFDYHR